MNESQVLDIFQGLDVKTFMAITAAVSVLTSTFVTICFQVWKRRREEKFDHGEKRADLEVERILRILLNGKKWPYRSFHMIRHNIGGYTDEELRRLLVRSGALRVTSKSGQELWISSRVAKAHGWQGGLLFNFPDDPDTPPDDGLFPALHTPSAELDAEAFERRTAALAWLPKALPSTNSGDRYGVVPLRKDCRGTLRGLFCLLGTSRCHPARSEAQMRDR